MRPALAVSRRADLVSQQRGTIERDADGAPAQRGIFLPLPARVRQHLVATQIESAEHHRLVAGGVEYLFVERRLIGKARHGFADHELQFGAEQADAVGARLRQMRHVEFQTRIHHQP